MMDVVWLLPWIRIQESKKILSEIKRFPALIVYLKKKISIDISWEILKANKPLEYVQSSTIIR